MAHHVAKQARNGETIAWRASAGDPTGWKFGSVLSAYPLQVLNADGYRCRLPPPPAAAACRRRRRC